MTDRLLLYGSAFLRAAATSMVAVLLGLYLAVRGLDPFEIGVIVGVGLSGAAAATLLVTMRGDRIGRRRSLIALTVLSIAGLIGLALASGLVWLSLAAFIGMVNGMGRDRGAALVLEQAALPSTATDEDRTRVFAWYNVIQDAGNALGALAAGLAGLARNADGLPPLPALQVSFGGGAAALAITAVLYLMLSPRVDAPVADTIRSLPARTRRLITGLAALFTIDGLGSGFLTTALLSYMFFEQFGTPPEWIAAMFFAARVLNALSHLAAAWLARRIGLVNTMVFTHIPSSLLLITVAFAPNFPIAAVFFLLREGLVEMDVPTRQSYLTAIVAPEDRTAASGITGLVRLIAWAVAPAVAGLVSESSGLMTPLIIGAALKITYDIALYAAFRRVKPPEELGARPDADAERGPGREGSDTTT